MPKAKFYLIVLWTFSFGCQYNSRPTAEALFHHVPKALDNYNLRKPDAKYFLPYVLEEISGLTYHKSGVIACVQDEEGKVFFYNHHSRKIDNSVRFADSGDYEGIATNGEKFYVAESNGHIYKFELNATGEIKKVKKYNTDLKKHNDVEGLVYDPALNKLLVACKGDGEIKGKEKKGKSVFYFDIDKKEIEHKAAFNITKNDIKNFLEQYKDFKYEENRINFKPSGIALHPINGHFYIIASVGKLLLITDRNGEIKGSIPIDPRLLGQPEGICFAPNGDLFISSEGQGDKGYILKFNMK
ncbi:MAG: SdiA-regulated domain-containing protein [Reichenbachiella sp.]|uniref:SdiA-regulated domain-containing protein n=1 Tax=Reichenbachiella sp. TaxID=2184521 RepID=UPI0032982FF7